MVLHSRLVSELNALALRVTLFMPQIDTNLLSASVDDNALPVETVVLAKSRLKLALSDARRYLREPIRDNAALWSRHQYLINGMAGIYPKYRAIFNYAAHRLLFKRRWAHACFDFLDRSLHRSTAIRNKLKQIKPDAVVSTYPVSSFEVSVLLEAQKLGIPTVGHLLSWDNITCKGRFTAVPDYFISWGPIMTAELQDHYHIQRKSIFECGVPHFDAHLDLIDRKWLERTLSGIGLDASKRYMFFGMSAPIFAPHEIEVVERLSQMVRENRFGSDMQLVVRPHPQNVKGCMADKSWLPRLKHLQGPRVGLNLPLLAEGGLDWEMQQDDLRVLVNLLAGCSVSLNSGSTLSIDALTHDKPVIVTMFDADRKDLPWWKSARRIRDYPHYKKLLSLGGVIPVGSFEELDNEITAALADQTKNSRARQETLMQECHAVDGKSCQRIAQAFASILIKKDSTN
jgi:hypothetical protein